MTMTMARSTMRSATPIWKSTPNGERRHALSEHRRQVRWLSVCGG
jgi:hypothetical protein